MAHTCLLTIMQKLNKNIVVWNRTIHVSSHNAEIYLIKNILVWNRTWDHVFLAKTFTQLGYLNSFINARTQYTCYAKNSHRPNLPRNSRQAVPNGQSHPPAAHFPPFPPTSLTTSPLHPCHRRLHGLPIQPLLPKTKMVPGRKGFNTHGNPAGNFILMTLIFCRVQAGDAQ